MTLSEEADFRKSHCPACISYAPLTRDGRHHPGYNGKRWYSCRAHPLIQAAENETLAGPWATEDDYHDFCEKQDPSGEWANV
jgi:hypothetical protein